MKAPKIEGERSDPFGFRRASAIHEAGHAVVALLEGSYLEEVFIGPGDNPTGGSACRCRVGCDHLAHLLAGGAAEKVLLGFTTSAARRDNARIRELTQEGFSSERERRAYVGGLRRAVRARVAEPDVRDAIEAFAAALLTGDGRLSGADCYSIVEKIRKKRGTK